VFFGLGAMDSQAIINQHQLGPVIRECRQGWISSQVRLLLLALLFIAPAFWHFLGNISPLSVQLILAPIGMVVLLWAACDGFLNRHNRQIICEQGLLDICRGKAKVVRYAQIKEIWTDVTHLHHGLVAMLTWHHYRIKTQDNREIISHFPAIGEWLRQETTGRLLPKYQEAYQQNQLLTFGKLVVSRRGITYDTLPIFWPELHSYGLNQGMFFIRKQGNNRPELWMTEPVAKIPNIDLLLAVLAEHHGPSQPMNP
jgi:hypothetical protein